jgi:phospholipid/cholesterol/gamma-HCH transport system permease protein
LTDNSIRAAPGIDTENTAEGVVVVLRGDWSAAMLAVPAQWEAIARQLAPLAQQTNAGAPITWDLRQLQRMDHTAAQLLWNAWHHQWPAKLVSLAEQSAMFKRVAQFTTAPPRPQSVGFYALFCGLGSRLFLIGGHLRGAVQLLGQFFLDSLRFFKSPSKGPWRDISSHLYRVGATALPITALVGFLVGVVLAYLMSRQLRQFGADTFIVNILGIALIRELGPVLAAILIAGRSGSAITAQIGVMRVTEELDAMRVMGIRTGFRLVMPRALAMLLAMPLLAVWTTAASLLGGMLASELAMGLSPTYFVLALPKVVQLSNLWLAIGKSAVFGLLIALIGCHYGLRVLPNTQSLGEGTTASVVTSITVVILVDALFAVLFKGVGL